MSSDLHSKSGYYAVSNPTVPSKSKTNKRRPQQTRQTRNHARYRHSSSDSENDHNTHWSPNPRPSRQRVQPQPQPRSKSKGRREKIVASPNTDVVVQHISGEDYYYTQDREPPPYAGHTSRRISQDSNATGSSSTRDAASSLHSMQPSNSHQRSRTDPIEFKATEWRSEQAPLQETDFSQSNLSELRMKAVQMEKAMRWWSECTANWREKWTKARAERNAARNEVKQLRESLSEALQEGGSLKAEKAALEDVVRSLRSEVDDVRREKQSSSGSDVISFKNSDVTENNEESDSLRPGKSGRYFNDNLTNNDDKMMSQRLSGLQMKFEESTKTIQAERDAKMTLNKSIENLEQELSSLRQKYEELKSSKQDIVKQLVRVREANKGDLERVNMKLEEELEANAEADKKLQELRSELERLQEENTLEWGKRERLETDKLQLERECKRVRSQRDELKETLSRRQKAAATTYENELREAQDELQESRKETAELHHLFNKQEKMIEEKVTEYTHCRRLAEQHESEVRTLRARVEEIKKQQTATEDELDSTQNQVRKQTRMLEEKDEETEKLQVQLDNLYTKFRRHTSTPTPQSFGNRLRVASRPNNDSSSTGSASSQED